jgi:hypothetical protein
LADFGGESPPPGQQASQNEVFENSPSEVQGSGDRVPFGWFEDTRTRPRVEATPEPTPVKLETSGLTRQTQGQFARLLRHAHRQTIALKLHEAGRHEHADPLDECRTRSTHALCKCCASHRVFWNRCDLWYCPECQPRLQRERQREVEWWTQQTRQAKHVVLTARNTSTLSAAYIRGIKSAFARLRRSRFARAWKGGLWKLEVTNEGRGWHVHIHALIDAVWIDARELATRWGKLVGQDFAIVKVKDARGADYLHELTKYVVKGDQLSRWTGAEIATLIDAMEGNRSFGVFGTLYRQRAEWRAFLDTLQAEGMVCECGSTEWHFYDDNEWEWFLTKNGPPRTRAP